MKILTTVALSLVTLAIFPFRGVKAAVMVGIVVRRISGCDYFMVQTPSDYAILEWYGGHDPDKDETLIGNFNSYGFHDFLYNDDDDKKSRFYVEDYGLSKTDALEELIDKCD